MILANTSKPTLQLTETVVQEIQIKCSAENDAGDAPEGHELSRVEVEGTLCTIHAIC